jgi:lysozyme family protein
MVKSVSLASIGQQHLKQPLVTNNEGITNTCNIASDRPDSFVNSNNAVSSLKRFLIGQISWCGSDKYQKLLNKHKDIIVNAKITPQAQNSADLKKFVANYEKNKEKYKTVAEKTDMPQHLIAALHWRESSGNFKTYLHQGDPLGKPAVHVPKNIPVFYEWEDAAVHALNGKKSIKNKFGITKDTTDLAPLLAFTEAYNGLGYFNKNRISPYVYSGSDVYTSGKYVADGKYDPNAKDKQLGTFVLIKSTENCCKTQIQNSKEIPADVQKKLSQLKPKVAAAAAKSYLECKQKGINIKILETYRTQERQNKLYAQGRTTPGPIVTKTLHSKHTERVALDFDAGSRQREAAQIFKANGFEWGGDWKGFVDQPHVQMVK